MNKQKIFSVLKSAGCVVLLTIAINSYTPPSTTVSVPASPDTIFALIPKPSEVVLMARLIESEARSESFEGKIMVGEVVVNRMAGRLEREIRRRGQFDGIHTKVFGESPPFESVAAAFFSLMGSDLLPDDILYYHNPETATDTAWVRYIEKYRYIREGRHVFCKRPDI